MHPSTPRFLAATLGLAAGLTLAIPSPGAAWDDLPCGATEATAHLCAPGEVARDGTIPTPLPLPAPVPVVPEVTPAPDLVQASPGPTAPAATPLVRYTCAQLVARHAGARSLRDRGCVKPPTCADLRARHAGVLWLVRFNCRTRLPGPFSPAVTG